MRVTYNAVVTLFFLAFQPFILHVFLEFGRDTDVYLELARGVGANYLEPFWFFLYKAIDSVSSYYLVKFYSMYLIFVLGSYLFFREGIKFSRGWFSKFSILFLVWSLQLSAVGGAFRQSIAVVFFAYFLLSFRVASHLLSALTHWSGALYLVYWGRGAYFILIVGSSLILSVFVFTLGLVQVDVGLIGRLLFYLSNPFSTDSSVIYGVVANKGIVQLIFLSNYNVLKRSGIAGKSYILYLTFMLSPLIQIVAFLATGSQQVLHRFGMIFDPFIFVFFVLILCRGNFVFRVLVFLLVLVKFVSRLVIVIEP